MNTAPDPAARPGTVAAAPAAPARPPGQPAGPAAWLTCLPGAAGVGYLAAWTAGLAAWPSNLPLNATAGQTAAAYAAHPAQAAVQYLLVEGLAGLLLGVVLGCALLPRLRGQAPLQAAGAAALGLVAVGTSVAQCVLGLLLTGAADGHDVTRCGELAALVNQLDGVKMLAIAGAAVLLAVPGGPAALPRWLRWATVPLAAALVASGCTYLAQSQGFAWTAYVSGPLLLLWVTSLGIALTIRQRAARSGRPSGRITSSRPGPGAGPGTGR
jgi:hypothetical protein